MMTRIGIIPEDVRIIKKEILGHQTEIERIVGKLNDLNGRLEVAWDGAAQEAFELSYGDWVSKLDAYVDTLASVQDYLESVVANYEQLDAAAKQAASNAAAAM